MTAPRKIEFAGGGTGGHLFPALALAQEFSRRFPNVAIKFWGTRRGVEYQIRGQLGFKLQTIRIRGLRRQFALSNLIIPFELFGSLFFLIFHYLFHRPDLVVGTGGYVSGPVVLTAACMGIKTAVHEQNSYPGATTRILARWVKRVYLTYESSKNYFKHQEKITVYGNPVRVLAERIDRQKALPKFGLQADKKTIFVFGGSQGGLGINKLFLEIAENLLTTQKIQILWSTGANHFEQIKAQMGVKPGLCLFPFIQNMYAAYSVCDLAVCRAGATTLAELTYVGVPAILIPFPFSAAAHQEFNARELQKAGAAICRIESETSAKSLAQEIVTLLDNEEKLTQMRKNMRNLARPNAAHDIVSDLCDNLLVCE